MRIENLKAYLANIDMTLKDFCIIIDRHPKHMSRVLKGKVFASKKLAEEIKQATGGIINLPIRQKKNQNKKEEQQKKVRVS